MALTAKKIINSETVYSFLENSFNEIVNDLRNDGLLLGNIAGEGQTAVFMGPHENDISYVRTATQIPVVLFQSNLYYVKSVGTVIGDFDPNKWVKKELNFQLFKDQADYDGTLSVSTYSDDDEAQKINYGIFRFAGGAVDPNQLVNVYIQTYSFEMLAFEEHRDDLKLILTRLASSLNGNIFSMTDVEGTFATFINVNDFPTMSATIDANGANKFLSSLIFVMTFYEDVVHSTAAVFLLDGIAVPYAEVNFNRKQVEPVADTKKAFEATFLPTRTTQTISVSGFYKLDSVVSKLFDFFNEASNLEETVRVMFSDGYRVKTGTYMIEELNIKLPYENIMNYTLTMIPVRNAPTTHFGLVVRGGNGTGEYAGAASVTITAEPENFNAWVISYIGTQNSEITTFLDTLDLESPTLTFNMPSSNLVFTATYEE